jgi:pentatricopeptide repeat protein
MDKHHLKPTDAVLVEVLRACAETGSINVGKLAWERIGPKPLMKDHLINLYGKCGDVKRALQLFMNMPKARTLTTWNIMFNILALDGQGERAKTLFEEMQQSNIKPNSETLKALLTAYKNSGMIPQSMEILSAMEKQFGIKPTTAHYNCVIDTLGGEGKFSEAEKIVKVSMDKPNLESWKSLIAACLYTKNVTAAREPFEHAMRMNSTDPSIYVMMANLYAIAGLEEERARVQSLLKDRHLQKTPGQTYIEIGSEVHRFTVDDKAHPELSQIHDELSTLNTELLAAGYKKDTLWDEYEDKIAWYRYIQSQCHRWRSY